MTLLTYILFYLGLGLHLAAAGAALPYLWSVEYRGLLKLASRLAALGALLLFATLLSRFLTWHLVPLTTSADCIIAFITFATVAALIITHSEKPRALLAFYLPPMAILCLAALWTAHPALSTQPRELFGPFLAVHVLLAYMAYALFFIASLTSAAYVYQARQLKRHAMAVRLPGLPSLENLDKTLYRLILIGYPFFAVTLLLGLFWTWYDPEPLSSTWWLSPKIFLSFCMALFYSICFHGRTRGLLRGPKLAYFVCIGFGLLLATYLVLTLLDLNNYNFYGAA